MRKVSEKQAAKEDVQSTVVVADTLSAAVIGREATETRTLQNLGLLVFSRQFRIRVPT